MLPAIRPYIPTAPQISREIITVLIGAIVAAAIINQIPSLKQWIKDQIGSTGSIPMGLF
jgi:hypothetical protein